MMRVAATGLNGLVGSKFKELYQDRYDLQVLDISDPVQPIDITQYDQVIKFLELQQPSALIHLAAFTDVSAAWEQRDDKNGMAYKVNVLGTQNIVQACEALNIHLVHISTAYVFDGKKEGLYTEEDELNPIEWYGYTKAEAENIVRAASSPTTILRIDFPFCSDSVARMDIVRKTIAANEKGYPLFADHYFGPTYIDDFAKVMDWSVRTQTTGLFNASSGEQWSDYQLGKELYMLGLTKQAPQAGSLSTYLATLGRPYQQNTAMDIAKLKNALDFNLLSITDALKQVHLEEEHPA